ncbi:MAG: DUF1294 domain-containing protein [Oscillospiraceae bacterium]|nr:DUF1294 domain-containing protein [Oscillospiraceae bacterium]
MNISEILQTIGQYIYIGAAALWSGIQWLWAWICEWVSKLPIPNAIKLFSNDTANKYLFFGILIYLLIMNIWAFTLFGADKSKAKRKQRRIRENKLFKVCFFGGAAGGIIGMNMFRHKTLKKKFSVGIPIMFVLQLILNSFILGFLGFWTFF